MRVTYHILDNGGKTADRYTLAILEESRKWHLSHADDRPDWPLGIGIIGGGTAPATTGDVRRDLNCGDRLLTGPSRRGLPRATRRFFGRILRWQRWYETGQIGAEPPL